MLKLVLAQHGALALHDLLRGMVSGIGAAVIDAVAPQGAAASPTARGIPLAT